MNNDEDDGDDSDERRHGVKDALRAAARRADYCRTH